MSVKPKLAILRKGDAAPAPTPAPEAQKTADFVQEADEQKTGGVKRVTLDVSAYAHKFLKSYCADNEISINDLLRDMIDKRFNIKSAPPHAYVPPRKPKLSDKENPQK